MAYPTNNHGEPLFLLAQINFAQLPKLPNYPDTGILQIFIASDDLYGADFEQPQNQNGFCMIYHKTVITDPNQLQHDFPTNADEDGLPIDNQPYALIAKGVELQPMTWADHQFDDKVVNLRDFASNHGHDTLDVYEYVPDTVGHRLGGNPYFTQGDIRTYGDYQDHVLLFQLDSDDATEGIAVMWGDVGVGNFFIHPNDLKNLDFSKVVYHWDCH